MRTPLGLASLLWVGLCGWALSYPAPRDPAEEPATLWERVKRAPARLLSGDEQAERARAVAQLGVSDWHRAGRAGRGVTVAVLDSGLKGWRAAAGKVLPAAVAAKSFRKDGSFDARDSQHGVLCGEVIHHLAPEAGLLLANWEPETPAAFLDAVRWAKRRGARVISCSMIMPGWSDGEGGGPVHRELTALLGDDTLLFASAGNTALRHWGGPAAPDRAGLHQWQPGVTANALRPIGAERVSVELAHLPGASFELAVNDAKTGEAVGRCRSDAAGNAVVRFEPRGGRAYAVTARVLAGGRPRFHLTALGARLGVATKAGSIPFPGDGPEVVAVSAVDESSRRQSYSSCGPVSARPKPDLSARVPFPSAWRPGQPFSGTSAAAPQAAALAALIWAAEPGLTAAGVRERLAMAARPVRTGHCVETGHGVIRLPPVDSRKSPPDAEKQPR
ncbi:MAG: S8 family serine peptidase [Gemmataceae bacterium]